MHIDPPSYNTACSTTSVSFQGVSVPGMQLNYAILPVTYLPVLIEMPSFPSFMEHAVQAYTGLVRIVFRQSQSPISSDILCTVVMGKV